MSPTLLDINKDMAMSPLFLGASAFLLLAYVIRTILYRPQKLDFPTVGSPNDANFAAALIEGSSKYPTTPFIIPTNPPTLIMPLGTHEEVRNLPEDKVSFSQEVTRMFHGKYTGIGNDSPAIIKTVKTDLTRHVASTVDALQDEMRYALDKEFGTCEDWTKVVLYEKLLKVVALLSGRVFVGRPLSRSEAWVKSSIQFTMDCVMASESVDKYPAWVRYFAVSFLPEIRRVTQHKAEAADLLRPVIEGCIRRFKEGKGAESQGGDEFDDEQGTFVSWIMKWTDEKNRENPFVLAENQLNLSFAAIHTTTMATAHMLFDLASHPEFIEPLREEIEQVIAEDGYDVDGSGMKNIKKQSFPKFKKLDSFLKESQRFNPPALTSRNWTPPSTFSPFRYASLRTAPGNESKYQFVTTSKESMNFGHGNHACPGRFFAGTEIKVVMVELLRRWDVRLIGDEQGVGGERPGNSVYDTTISPNPFAELEFRRRRV
ncbi:hypothetical protein SBOR_6971 [Sclerotinia borealis F-4128]|uniref:Cytochrome P450 n=1 Tax=Sclerotinia borealis (strain F-4128) TaxID=1432307 RepID=W9C798_SCLBF|nr:hypothetical protein SBOR_6971 [Sclerotinia borealis F-4128]